MENRLNSKSTYSVIPYSVFYKFPKANVETPLNQLTRYKPEAAEDHIKVCPDTEKGKAKYEKRMLVMLGSFDILPGFVHVHNYNIHATVMM